MHRWEFGEKCSDELGWKFKMHFLKNTVVIVTCNTYFLTDSKRLFMKWFRRDCLLQKSR